MVSYIRTPHPEEPHRPPATAPSEKKERIVVFSHGWHTGIVIPTNSLQRHPWTKDLKMNQSRYAEFGWGDEKFYRTEGINLRLMVRAMFWPTAAVIHLERFSVPPYKHYTVSQIVRLDLTKQEMDKLIDELRRSFSANPDGSLINLGHGAEADSTYFRSRFKYYYPETCNIWTSRILNAAGINIKESIRSPELISNLRKSGKAVQ